MTHQPPTREPRTSRVLTGVLIAIAGAYLVMPPLLIEWRYEWSSLVHTGDTSEAVYAASLVALAWLAGTLLYVAAVLSTRWPRTCLAAYAIALVVSLAQLTAMTLELDEVVAIRGTAWY